MATNAIITRAALMAESGGYGVIPDATGASALWVPGAEGVMPVDEKQTIQLQYAHGRASRPKTKMGALAAMVELSADLHGLATSSFAAGQARAADNWFDLALKSLFGNPLSHDSAAVTAGTTSSITAAGLSAAIGEMLLVRGANVNNGYGMWSRSASAASPFSVDPDMPAAPDAASIVAPGSTYYPKNKPGQSGLVGNSLTAIVDVDGEHYAIPGCRPSRLQLAMNAGEACKVNMSLMGDRRLRQNFASFPDSPSESCDPCIGLLSPVVVNDVEYDIESVTVDLAPRLSNQRSTRQLSGRSDKKVISAIPTVSISPLAATVWEDLYDNQTIFDFMVQFGSGAWDGTRYNTVAFFCHGAQVTAAVNYTDSEGHLRHNIQVQPCDRGASGVEGFFWQLGIA